MDHGENVTDWDVDIFPGGRVGSETYCGCAEEGTDVVGSLETFFGAPADVVLVGEDGRTEGAAVVTAYADHHETIMKWSHKRWFRSKVDITYPVFPTCLSVLN
jgi:hypothetical protein